MDLHGAFVQENWISLGGSFFICHGISIVIPRSSGILEWVEYQNMGSYQVTIELPPNWYENNDLLGFALRCVYVASPNESQYESAHTSEDEPNNRFAFASEIERLVFFCILSVRGNNQSAKVDVFSFESRSVNDGVSDTVWLIFYPKVAFKEAIKESYRSSQWTHFTASFAGFGRVEECGIRLIYTKDFEQKHPTMAQGNSSHGNFGKHGSSTEATNSKAHDKSNPMEQSPVDESCHKRFRGTQD